MDRKSFISFLYKVGNTSIETNNISISATNNALLLITAAGQITGALMPTDNNPRTKPDAIDTLFGEVVKVCSNDADDDVLLGYSNFVVDRAFQDALSHRFSFAAFSSRASNPANTNSRIISDCVRS